MTYTIFDVPEIRSVYCHKQNLYDLNLRKCA